MKGSVIALDEIAGHKAAARIVDGVLEDLFVDPGDDAPPGPGAILRAVCDRPVKGQGGMFVRLPEGTGFIRGAKGLAPGQELLVQVTGYAEPGKALPVTTRVLFKSRHVLVTPDAPGLNVSRAIKDEERRVDLLELAQDGAVEGEGLILRSACETADDDVIVEDIAATRALARTVLADTGTGPELLVEAPNAHELAWRDWPTPDQLDDDPGAFARHGVESMIETLRGPETRLAGQALAYIEPTRALVAIDVNTRGDTSPAAGLKANIALAKALPRALRCRGLGGQIVIDLAPMPKKDRRVFEQTLRAAFRADSVETALVGWTPLGHFELQRKRERLPLSEALS